MMLGFELLKQPIDFDENNINVLCLENKQLYRNIVKCFYDENFEEQNLVLSQDYEPMKYKGNVLFISDYYNHSLSSSVMKKLYDEMAKFCVDELQMESTQIHTQIINYIDMLIAKFDYDFDYNVDFSLQDLYKVVGIKPIISTQSLLDSLLDYILIVDKYIRPKLFVLLNLHLYFDNEELTKLYSDLNYHHINLLIIENNMSFIPNVLEKVIIIDEDLCEIVDN